MEFIRLKLGGFRGMGVVVCVKRVGGTCSENHVIIRE